jgi:arsenate reductase (thioredoxin)
MKKLQVLVLCTGNSARSQMAEGLLRHDGGDGFDVVSAGTHPTRLRPEAVAAMQEVGIDISGQWSKPVDAFAGREFDYVITVCDSARESCPVFPARTQHIHWSIEDPAGVEGGDPARLAAFRQARDDLRSRIQHWIAREAR